MSKQLFVIDYESIHWCGGHSYVLVWAEDTDDAIYLSEDHRESEMRELFASEYEEEDYEEDGPYSTIISVDLLSESDHKEFTDNVDQRNAYYPIIGGAYEKPFE